MKLTEAEENKHCRVKEVFINGLREREGGPSA